MDNTMLTNLSALISKLETPNTLTTEELADIEREIRFISLYNQAISLSVQLAKAQGEYTALGLGGA